MSDSKRLATLKALSAHLLATIQTANGYNHDLIAVSRGRLVFGDDDTVPFLSIVESPHADVSTAQVGYDGLRQLEDWVLLVQGWAAEDTDNPTDPAYELMADTKKALAVLKTEGASNYLLNGLIDDMRVEPGTVRPPDQTSTRAFFWMRVILKFDEAVDDPYRL